MKLINYLKKPVKMVIPLGGRGVLDFLSDEFYLKLLFKARLDKNLSLNEPKTFNEKIQWLKIYDRKPLYSRLVDKYEVRKYVSKNIGDKYLIPLLGVWESFEEINFSSLPKQFVLKTTHDSGGVVLCHDKDTFNFKIAENILTKSLNRKYSKGNREKIYDNVQPRIIAESYLESSNEEGIDDYKFFCFNGEVKALYIASERQTATKFDFFDKDFYPLELKQYYPNSNKTHIKPHNYSEMIAICEKLSKNIPHVRIDLYNLNGHIYFGEMTFYHLSGARKFEPEIFDTIFGDWLDLPIK